MMNILVTLSVFVILLCYVDAKGLILPNGMEQRDYCKGCIATVQAISERKKDGMSAKKIISKVDKMCSSLVGEKNRTTCHHLLENHNHDLEKIIREVDKLQEMKTWFCHEHTFACIGVRHEKQERKEMSDEELLAHISEHAGPTRRPNPVRATDEL